MPQLIEITEMLNRGRIMRYGRQDKIKPRAQLEPITRRGVIRAANRHVRFTRDFLTLLPGVPNLDTIRRAEGVIKAAHSPGCKCCEPGPVLKEFTADDLREIDRQFTELTGPVISLELDRLADQLARDMAGGVGVQEDRPIFDAMFTAVILETVRIALYKLKQRAIYEGITAGGPTINAGADWVADLYDNGYKLVKGKVFRFYLPGIKEGFNTGFRSGLSGAQIGRALNMKYGVNSAWQWQRLWRTEMAAAIDRTSRAQYEAWGAMWGKWSASPVACEICAEIATADVGFGRGVYRISEAPRSPAHPNCRCFLTPIFNL